MITFKKIRYKNFLSSGDQFTEIDFQQPHTNLIIGTNGAGKSTLLKAIMGLIPISGGRLYVNNTQIINVKSHELVKKGIGYVPQVLNVFPTLNVEENLEIGLWTKNKDTRENKKEIFEMFPILFTKKREKA